MPSPHCVKLITCTVKWMCSSLTWLPSLYSGSSTRSDPIQSRLHRRNGRIAPASRRRRTSIHHYRSAGQCPRNRGRRQSSGQCEFQYLHLEIQLCFSQPIRQEKFHVCKIGIATALLPSLDSWVSSSSFLKRGLWFILDW